MNIEPTEACVFQPLPPQDDGRFYGVSGPESIVGPVSLRGVTKADAERIAADCNSDPDNGPAIVESVRKLMQNDWLPECGCRFESLFSNSVLVCACCAEQHTVKVR